MTGVQHCCLSMHVWTSHLKGDICTIENVQSLYTTRLPGCINLTYAERIDLSYADPPWSFVESNDLIMCYKIVFGIVRLEIVFFHFNTNISTRSHLYKLYVMYIITI